MIYHASEYERPRTAFEQALRDEWEKSLFWYEQVLTGAGVAYALQVLHDRPPDLAPLQQAAAEYATEFHRGKDVLGFARFSPEPESRLARDAVLVAEEPRAIGCLWTSAMSLIPGLLGRE